MAKVLLDSSAIIDISRQKYVAGFNKHDNISVSIITLGEISEFNFPIKGREVWGHKKKIIAEKLIAKSNIIEIRQNSKIIYNTYGEMHAFKLRYGFGIGQSDIWIASSAIGIFAKLISTDKALIRFVDEFIKYKKDPKNYTIQSHKHNKK